MFSGINGQDDTGTGNQVIDCYVDNGGCSHTCASNTCQCPPCWKIGTDNLNCVPESDKVVTSCNANTMVVTVDKCVLDSTHDATTAKMVSGDCAFVTNSNDKYEMTVGLDTCGTELSFTANTIDYKVNPSRTVPY